MPSTIDRGRRRALVIGVGVFDPAPLGDLALDADRCDDLDFAVPLSQRLAATFETYRDGGFDVTCLLNPDREQIRDAVAGVLDDRSPVARVVHVVSHGRHGPQSDRVEVVGRCRRGGQNNVREWVSAAQADGVPTLFLVDLCAAGRAANLSFTRQPGEGEMTALVIAAAAADEDAWDGALTKIATDVVAECGANGLGATSTHVPLREFTRRIADALRGQTLTTTMTPLHHEIDLPFFPNPQWRPNPVQDQVTRMDAVLRPLLDDEGEGGLWIVAGAPGAGKSALLGALVCAAHPQLAEVAGHVRKALDDPPAVNPLLVAAHARQRSLDEITASIGRQLGLTPPDGRRPSWSRRSGPCRPRRSWWWTR